MGRILSGYEDFREELELSVSKKKDCMKGAIRMRKFCYANGGPVLVQVMGVYREEGRPPAALMLLSCHLGTMTV